MDDASNAPRGVFVYGTLLSGFAPHARLAVGLRRVRPGHVEGLELVHLPEGYPAAFRAPEFTIRGELLEFEALDEVLVGLDQYEDCDPTDPGSLYRREVVEVALDEGGVARAWCYLYADGSCEQALDRGGVRVPWGDWRRFVGGRVH